MSTNHFTSSLPTSDQTQEQNPPAQRVTLDLARLKGSVWLTYSLFTTIERQIHQLGSDSSGKVSAEEVKGLGTDWDNCSKVLERFAR